ncbi:hypothetical protein ACMFMF_000139 [Clarireedia jacksonii]
MSPSWSPSITAADVVGLTLIVELDRETVEREFEEVIIVVGINPSIVGPDAGLGLSITDNVNCLSVVAAEPSVRLGTSAEVLPSGTKSTSPTDVHNPSKLEIETTRSDAAVWA